MNERDLDIAWVDAELAFMEIQKKYEGTRRDGRDEDGNYSGAGDGLQGSEPEEAGRSLGSGGGGAESGYSVPGQVVG